MSLENDDELFDDDLEVDLGGLEEKPSTSKLSDFQRDRMEKNRLKAMALKKSKLQRDHIKPYQDPLKVIYNQYSINQLNK